MGRSGAWGSPHEPVKLPGASSRRLLALGWALRAVACLFLLLILFESTLPGGAHVWGRVGVVGAVVFTLVGFAVSAASARKGHAEEARGYTTRRSRTRSDPSLVHLP